MNIQRRLLLLFHYCVDERYTTYNQLKEMHEIQFKNVMKKKEFVATAIESFVI